MQSRLVHTEGNLRRWNQTGTTLFKPYNPTKDCINCSTTRKSNPNQGKNPVILKPCTLFSIYPGLFTARWNEFLKRTIWDTDETRQVWRGVFIWIKANHQMISSKKVTRSDLWEHQSNISPPPVVSNIALLIWVTRIINTPATKCEASFFFFFQEIFVFLFCFSEYFGVAEERNKTKLDNGV